MNPNLRVALPWSQSHYIALNGFHPLYRPLIETRPQWVQLAAWNNIHLSKKMKADKNFRSEILREAQRQTITQKPCSTLIERKYFAHFWAPDQVLTRLLPGDLEFHHTAPFPSLKRPFVFHCESFAPVFVPFAHQGTGRLLEHRALRAHYKAIFEHPLCLGISSHLPQTLEDLSHFLDSPKIDDRFFSSRIGLFGSGANPFPIAKGSLDAPICLFINSAHQNPKNFFLRGGHLILRAWQLIYSAEPGAGRLIMRCSRPMDGLLADHGVNLEWLKLHERRSIIWIEDYLGAADLDSLMQAAHFFLLPSVSLHSVSIMQAMAAGAVPVVSDTLGTDRYVTDAVDGIVLKGVFASNWSKDHETGVMIDRYQHNSKLDDSLVQQIVMRLGDLLKKPARYRSIQEAARAQAGKTFSGKAFSEDFWRQVLHRYQALPESTFGLDNPLCKSLEIEDCLLNQSDWKRIFTSPPQPVERLDAGRGKVFELGGCFVGIPSHISVDIHDWSPIAEYVNSSELSLEFSEDIRGLHGNYLGAARNAPIKYAWRRLVQYISELLIPYPLLFSFGSGSLRRLRRLHRAIRHLMANIANH